MGWSETAPSQIQNEKNIFFRVIDGFFFSWLRKEPK